MGIVTTHTEGRVVIHSDQDGLPVEVVQFPSRDAAAPVAVEPTKPTAPPVAAAPRSEKAPTVAPAKGVRVPTTTKGKRATKRAR
ncbi:MAG: hypothetical protein ABI665_14635 [Vicinamibacterales bacterium]